MINAERVLREKRGLMLPLVAGLVVNVGLLVLAVLPLTRAVRAEEARAAEAAAARTAAEQALARSEAIVSGKARADEELRRFYGQVLPADFTAARRIAYLNLQQLARQAGLQLSGQSTALPSDAFDEGILRRYRTELTLGGTYAAIRQFIHAIETQPSFLIIENVELATGTVRGDALQVTLTIATYYRESDGR